MQYPRAAAPPWPLPPPRRRCSRSTPTAQRRAGGRLSGRHRRTGLLCRRRALAAAPSLIVGHRGMPSEYIENTTPPPSALHLPARTPSRTTSTSPPTARSSSTTMNPSPASLAARTSRTSTSSPERDPRHALHQRGRGGRAGRQPERRRIRYGYIRYLSSQRMPTLREFFELFKDSDVVHDTEIKTNDPAIVIALHNPRG